MPQFYSSQLSPHCIYCYCTRWAGAYGCTYESSAGFCAHNEPGYQVCRERFLFNWRKNDTSDFLRTFYHLLQEVALVGTHIRCTDPVIFFLGHGSFKSTGDQIKQSTSKRCRNSSETIASPAPKYLLSELLIASSSYPINGMSRSIPSQQLFF